MFEEVYKMIENFEPVNVEKLKKEAQESESVKRIKEETRRLEVINAVFKK